MSQLCQNYFPLIVFVSHVLHVGTVIAVKYYCGISVLMRYILNVLVNDASV